jgi:hypothetical protein
MPTSVTSAHTDPGAVPATRALTGRPAGIPVAGLQWRPSADTIVVEEPSSAAVTAT